MTRSKRLFSFALTAIVGAALAAPVSAATGPYLVKDIRASGASHPQSMTAVGNMLFFSAFGPGGRELWKSDGTSAGTIRVKDIRPGPRSSSLGHLINLGGTLYFTANDGTGAAIWKSNGTEAGTQIVDHVNASLLTNVQGLLYFISSDELWRTDGTPSGAVMLKQVASSPDTFVTEMAAVGNRLFISVYGGATDELWVSDGTELGTTLVDTLSSARSNGIRTLTGAGGRLFFLFDEHVVPQSEFQQSSAQLWTSDGTPGSTRLVKNFVPGHPDYVDNLMSALGRAFFVVDGELHKSTGGAGTQTLGASAFSSPPLTIVGGTIFFVGPGGIWKTDGSAAGIQHVTDAEPHLNSFCNPHGGPCHIVFRDYDPAGAAGRLVFPSRTSGEGVELWATNGTAQGSALAGDIFPGPDGSKPADLIRVGNAIYFTANDGVHGRELWRFVP